MFISHFKSLSGKARHQGLLTHDREDRFTTEMGKQLPQRSPPPLRWRCRSPLYSLPSVFFSGWCRMPSRPIKNDSLVGGNSKRVTLTPLSSSCMGPDSRRVISPSLTTPNFSVRWRIAKTRKESQDPRSRKSSLGNAPRHRPCHRHHALWG